MSQSQIQIFINKKLEESGMTQKDFAEKANIAAAVISNISNGHKSNTSIHTLYKIASTLNCLIDEVYGRNVETSHTNVVFTSLTTESLTSNLKSFLQKKMTQYDMSGFKLEKEAHLGLGSISSFMKAASSSRSLNSSTIIALADYFNVSIDEMIGRSSPSIAKDLTKNKTTPNKTIRNPKAHSILKDFSKGDIDILSQVSKDLSGLNKQNSGTNVSVPQVKPKSKSPKIKRS